jgi:tellurite resistance protein TerC
MLEISGLTWAVTIGVIVALLALDLALAAWRPHRVGFEEATAWSVFYIATARWCPPRMTRSAAGGGGAATGGRGAAACPPSRAA